MDISFLLHLMFILQDGDVLLPSSSSHEPSQISHLNVRKRMGIDSVQRTTRTGLQSIQIQQFLLLYTHRNVVLICCGYPLYGRKFETVCWMRAIQVKQDTFLF